MNITLDLGQMMIGIAVLITMYQNWRNSKLLDTVHNATNSMKDALVAATEKESYARGVKDGGTSSANQKET